MTDIFVTHGHGDHWFAAGLLAERFGARVVASAGTIAQMHAQRRDAAVAVGQGLPGIPPSSVIAVTVPDNRFTLEGHDLVMVEVGHTDSDDTSVLHVPDLGLVVAGDSIYNGVHMYLGQSAVGGFGPWRDAMNKVEALRPRHIVCGHQDKQLDDDAGRTIAQTRQYLDDADDLLRTETTAVGFFNAKIERYPAYLGPPGPVGERRAPSMACANTPKETPPRSSSTPGSESPSPRCRTPPGRPGSGLPRRQNALDPGFHDVPAGPAHPPSLLPRFG